MKNDIIIEEKKDSLYGKTCLCKTSEGEWLWSAYEGGSFKAFCWSSKTNFKMTAGFKVKKS